VRYDYEIPTKQFTEKQVTFVPCLHFKPMIALRDLECLPYYQCADR